MAFRVGNYLCGTKEGRRLSAVILSWMFRCCSLEVFVAFCSAFLSSAVNSSPAIEVQFIPWSLCFLVDAEEGMCGSRQIHSMSPGWVGCVTEQRQCGQ